MTPRPVSDTTIRRIADFAIIATAGCTLMVGSASFWEWNRDRADQANLLKLNRMVAEYQHQTGRIPDMNLIELFHCGWSSQRLHGTPYGGTYQIDPHQRLVYNPHRPR
jgi:hypothetical protein